MIHKETNQVAHYYTISILYREAVVLLIIDFILQVVNHYAVSALYMLMLILVLPIIIQKILSSFWKEKEETISIINTQFGYNKKKKWSLFYSLSIVLLIAVFWQWANNTSSIERSLVRDFPICFIVILGIGYPTYFLIFRSRIKKDISERR